MTNNSHPSRSREVKALQKKYDVASSGRLFISVPGADLELASHHEEKVLVDVFVDSLSQNEALAIVDRVKLRIRAIDNQTVRIESRSFYSDGFTAWNSGQTMSMRLVIKLPRSFNVDLQTAASNIVISGIEGRMTIQGSGGTLTASQLKGKLEVYGYGCDVNIDNIEGSKVAVVAASGSVDANHIKANQISIRASSCSSTISNLEGQTSLYLHGGTANISKITGPLDVQSQSCEAHVYVDHVDDTNLSIRGGKLGLHVKNDLQAKLLFEGQEIHIDDSLSFQGQHEDGKIEGVLNRGKSLLHARASAAEIRCVNKG